MQVAITQGNKVLEEDLTSSYYPQKVDAKAAKANGLSISYRSGRKTLVNKNGDILPAIAPDEAAARVKDHIVRIYDSSRDRSVLLIA